MDFDDLDDAEAELEAALGPSPEELRQELMARQMPSEMKAAVLHPASEGMRYGGGSFKSQKVLYLHGPGSTYDICEQQVAAMFDEVPWVSDFKIFEWDFWMGWIKSTVEECHFDPAVQEVFRPYGPDFYSYFAPQNLNRQDERWDGFDEVIDRFADKLSEDGPYDGLCGFDMGGNLAFEAARLAQEGDARFMGKFRYLMLFSTHAPKKVCMRPNAPLQIPTFLGWSESDDGRPYPAYEDLCLYIHPGFRSVIIHDQGHRPPRIKGKSPESDELDRFVHDVQSGTLHRPSEGERSTQYRGYWLPLARVPAPKPPAESARLMIVVPDPMGTHGPRAEEALERSLFPAQEHLDNCKARLRISRSARGMSEADFRSASSAVAPGPSVRILSAKLRDEHRSLSWLPVAERRDVSEAYVPDAGRSRWVAVEDECAMSWEQLREIAEEMLGHLTISRSDHVGVVGVGSAAVLAVALCEAIMQRRQVVPAGLWTICGPPVWQSVGAPELGALVTTPVRYLTPASAVSGPPWRLECCTMGPFSHGHFSCCEEAAQMVMTEFCCGD